MNENELRAQIRARILTGHLPLDIPIPNTPGQSLDAFAVRLGGSKCSACDGNNPDFTITYPNGKEFSLHRECGRIWKEERDKPTLIPKG